VSCCTECGGRLPVHTPDCPLPGARVALVPYQPEPPTVESALALAAGCMDGNPVGALRLVAWAMARAVWPLPLRYQQGPEACCALLAGASHGRG
jgi:hypothetical protein